MSPLLLVDSCIYDPIHHASCSCVVSFPCGLGLVTCFEQWSKCVASKGLIYIWIFRLIWLDCSLFKARCHTVIKLALNYLKMRDYLRHKSLRQTSRCLATTNNATWSRYTPSTIGPVQNAEFWANKRLCFKLRNLEMVCFPTDSWDAIYNFAATLCELSNSSPFHTVFAYFSAFESEFLCCRQNFILCSKCPSHSMNRVWIDLPCKSILGIFTPQTLTVGLLKVTCKMFIYKDTQQLPLWGYTPNHS